MSSNEQIKFTANWLGTKIAVLLMLAGVVMPSFGMSPWPWSFLLIVAGIGCFLAAYWYLGKLR